MSNRRQREKFERMMLRHLDAAYNLALWLLRDSNDAQDIVQTAYMRAFEHFAGFNGGNPAGWILTIVRNTAYNWLNKQKRDSNLISFDEILHGKHTDSDIPLSRMTPEQMLEVNSNSQYLMTLMDRLPAEYREVIYLREIEGYSYKEIAEITEVPTGTVMSRLSRARAQLQTMVADQSMRKRNREV